MKYLMENLADLAKEVEERVKDYKEGKVNDRDIFVADADRKDAARRMEEAGSGLVAMSAGTWTPSSDWLDEVTRLVSQMNAWREEMKTARFVWEARDNGYDEHMWRSKLAEIEDHGKELEAILKKVLP